PALERQKQLIVYDDSIHNYETDKPSFQEIKPGQFVWANTEEAENYKAQH
ncbi:MAG: peptide ABC transporter ATP-binding protein, partial [Lactococcus raffinolactis]